jgi:hypothetical protein
MAGSAAMLESISHKQSGFYITEQWPDRDSKPFAECIDVFGNAAPRAAKPSPLAEVGRYCRVATEFRPKRHNAALQPCTPNHVGMVCRPCP